MNADDIGPVLVVCADADRSTEILGRLHDGGMSAVGPVPTAGLALALAAQGMAGVAILAGQTTGRRTTDELAQELTSTWGVDCYVLPHADDAPNAMDDALETSRTTALRKVLQNLALHQAPIQ